jgi:hypothetical protein
MNKILTLLFIGLTILTYVQKIKIINMKKKWFLIIAVVIGFSSCKKDEKIVNVDPKLSPMPKTVVYKLRSNYIQNVCIGLNVDKTSILCYPSNVDPCGNQLYTPYAMNNGYMFDVCTTYGLNSAFLKLTKTEYQNVWNQLTLDSLYKLILDKDPFIEYYVDENRILDIAEPTGFMYDTIKLNDIITNNELSVKLKRLK